MNKRNLSLSDRKELYLLMMDEVDSFCREHNIRYSLTCGTLIGAIRHKGFIPWDDDLDIMMPLPDMIKFKNTFVSESLRYVDVDVDNSYQYSFSRIESLKTYTYIWPFYHSFGLSIDLYPILGLPKRNIEIDKFFFAARKKLHKRVFFDKWEGKMKRFSPVRNWSKATEWNKLYRDFMFQFPYGETGRFYHMGGCPNWAAVLDHDFFNDFIDVDFEGRRYRSILQYDEFLTNGYGDYMQLPPESERHPYHREIVYWK